MLGHRGFLPGNTYGKGRPPKSKNQIETIRRRILRVVRRRIMREKDLDTVSTTDLLKFLATIMPKDFGVLQASQINYISSVPRLEGGQQEDKPAVIEVITQEQINDVQQQETPLLETEKSGEHSI